MFALVAVTDSVFPNLDAARQIVPTVGAELLLAKAATSEAILEVATTADAVLTTYAKMTPAVVPIHRETKALLTDQEFRQVVAVKLSQAVGDRGEAST